MSRYLFAAQKTWNIEAFMSSRAKLPGEWALVTHKEDLAGALESFGPRYVFFPHWSHIVPAEILQRHECVCFHMTDVPYGRGGSPLQNLIAAGHKETMLTALRMTDELDAGPVYLKRPLRLEGSAEEIFRRAAVLCMDMMDVIARTEPAPEPQTGTPHFFKRRRPEQSLLPTSGELTELYDHIRMLDAPGYPHAYVPYGDFRLELTEAQIAGEAIEAKVSLRRPAKESAS